MAINLKGPQPGRRRHFAKYALVSVVATVTSLTILGLLVGVCGWSSVWANVLATAIGTVPSFELNRRWVWSQRGQRPRVAQVVPFCALSLAGLVVSTFAVHVAGNATISSGRIVHTAAVEVANFGAYGALWLLQFFLCEKVLFKKSAVAPAGTSVDTDSATRIRRDRFAEIDSAA
jgi:putative flippase GtrA